MPDTCAAPTIPVKDRPALRHARRSRHNRVTLLLLAVLLCMLPACGALSHERLVYDEQGVQIGIEHDPSTSGSPPTVLNGHPARLTVEELRALLGSVQVSGWSGMIGGLLKDPSAIPLFKDEELRLVLKPLASALSQAGPNERVFFSVPSLTVRYNEDRTAGSLFIRGPYLHLTLQDHTAFVRTDTAGGDDYKDPRDFKGMHLWLARPAQPASLPPAETPAWGPFEKVHISMKIQDVLAARSLPNAAQARPPVPQTPAAQPVPVPPAPSTATGGSGTPPAAESAEDMRVMLRELSSANLELRSRLKDQAQDMQTLKDELAKLKQELTDSKAKAKPRRKPAQSQQ